MSLKKNSSIIGKHAFLSPSNYHWIDYNEDKLRRVYFQKKEAQLGTDKHELAQRAIKLRQPLKDGTTMGMYVNDCIGYRMQPEVPLFYNVECFGTADALKVTDAEYVDEQGKVWDVLRIFDLKTGVTEASMKQLLIYAGIFFHEFAALYDPRTTKVVLRIYQLDNIVEHLPTPEEMLMVMGTIKFLGDLALTLGEED